MAHLRRLFATLAVLVLASLAGLAAPSYGVGTTPSQTATAQLRQPQGASVRVAATGYTYWAYFTWDDSTSTWELATVGANDKKIKPHDGDVFGFRWALNLGTASAREPRAAGDFDAICGGTPAGSDPRVAFVIDYGTTTDAVGDDETPQPRGVCATVKDNFTVQQTLQSVTPVRASASGFICAIDDYPSTGCGETVKNAQKPSADKTVELALPAGATGDTPGETSGDDASGATTEPTGSSSTQDDSSSNVWPILIPAAIVVILAGGVVVMRRRQS